MDLSGWSTLSADQTNRGIVAPMSSRRTPATITAKAAKTAQQRHRGAYEFTTNHGRTQASDVGANKGIVAPMSSRQGGSVIPKRNPFDPTEASWRL